MTTNVLQQKTSRYLRGESVPSEKRQIQTWLSCTENKEVLSEEEKLQIENDIVRDVHNYIAYSTFNPEPKTWWKKITACF